MGFSMLCKCEVIEYYRGKMPLITEVFAKQYKQKHTNKIFWIYCFDFA